MLTLQFQLQHIVFCSRWMRQQADNIRFMYLVNQIAPHLQASPIDMDAVVTITIKATDLVWFYSQVTVEREGLSAHIARQLKNGNETVPGLLAQLMAAMSNPAHQQDAAFVLGQLGDIASRFDQTLQADYLDSTVSWLLSVYQPE